ncbi:MAG: hypothetical protein U0446_11735 [Dehalococcoidia bacterium]
MRRRQRPKASPLNAEERARLAALWAAIPESHWGRLVEHPEYGWVRSSPGDAQLEHPIIVELLGFLESHPAGGAAYWPVTFGHRELAERHVNELLDSEGSA